MVEEVSAGRVVVEGFAEGVVVKASAGQVVEKAFDEGVVMEPFFGRVVLEPFVESVVVGVSNVGDVVEAFSGCVLLLHSF